MALVGSTRTALATAVAAATLVGCFAPSTYECASSSACDALAGGVCEPDGACAYPDASCASGRRYGEQAGGKSGSCTSAAPGDDGGPRGDGGPGDDGGGGFATARFSQGFGKVVCAVLDDGRAYCAGKNQYGQAGVGDAAPDVVVDPLPVAGDHAWREINVGDSLGCGADLDGGAWCWGADPVGQVGNGPGVTGDQHAPSAVLGLDAPALDVACGSAHACAIVGPAGAAGGEVRCWGANARGQLGVAGGPTDQAAAAVDLDGVAAVAIYGGQEHSCALGADGALRCWGDLTFDDVIAPPTTIASDVVAFASGDFHGCGILAGGVVRCQGQNQLGQHGDGTTGGTGSGADVDLPAAATAIVVGQQHTCALVAGGEVHCWGLNASGQVSGAAATPFEASPVEVALDRPAIALGASEVATCAQLDDGAIVCWGDVGDVLGRHAWELP